MIQVYHLKERSSGILKTYHLDRNMFFQYNRLSISGWIGGIVFYITFPEIISSDHHNNQMSFDHSFR